MKVAVALAPALTLLVAYDRLDSFELVRLPDLARTLGAGALISLIGFLVNGGSLDALPIAFTDYSRYVAPVVEECLKAAFIAWLILRGRIGFTIDAAIQGAALGVGFAVCENGYYLWFVEHANLGVWIVRGFGTALMHGGATAIFAVLGHAFVAGRERGRLFALLPGLAGAILVHGAYNQLPDRPLVAMAAALVVCPLLLLAAEYIGTRTAERRLRQEYDSHIHMFEALNSAEGEAGRLVRALTSRLDPHRAEEVRSYVKLHLGLLAEAEARLLEMEEGRAPSPDPTLEARFAQLRAAEKAFGRSLLRSLRTQLHFTQEEMWELHHLEGEVETGLHRRLRRFHKRPVPGN
ncbi:MAG TPA: PrsW family glutamic-type intramembrane protease [Caulobacteraceae bacterium]|nr:PrsW family glutamic-type intramembrane protease [Caulobacteraceae bacterium]